MKGLIVLLCALVAVQARSTAVTKNTRTEAALGENPWIVHLRIAVSTSGLLETCAGSLIDNSWVLTAATCVSSSRFIWIRYGTINVINSELVTENSIVRLAPGFDENVRPVVNNVALISINRFVQSTANISPVALATADAETPSSGTFCSYNDAELEYPGEQLTCGDVELTEDEEGNLVADLDVSQFDFGAPLVKDGVQYGLVANSFEGATTFLRPEAFLDWIEEQTGVDFTAISPVVMPDNFVNFVN